MLRMTILSFYQNPRLPNQRHPGHYRPRAYGYGTGRRFALAAAAIYQRGNLIHKLLQYFPMRRRPSADALPKISLPAISKPCPKKIDECIREALAVIDDPAICIPVCRRLAGRSAGGGLLELDGKPVPSPGRLTGCLSAKRSMDRRFQEQRQPPLNDAVYRAPICGR